jgi:hypothetical protein
MREVDWWVKQLTRSLDHTSYGGQDLCQVRYDSWPQCFAWRHSAIEHPPKANSYHRIVIAFNPVEVSQS